MEVIQTTKTHTQTAKAPPRLLVDSQTLHLQLVEGTTPGKVMMRGEFARCDVATANKRIYPKKLWEREIVRLNKAMENRQLFGELDHPGTPGTELNRCSHIITNMRVENGLVVGEAQILDTDRGRNLKAILEAGAKVGISSRGHGSVRMNERGEDVVQEDYRLVTFDFVADPADSHAVPDVFYESKGNHMERTDGDMAQDFAREIEKAQKEGRHVAEESLRAEFEKELLVRFGELRAEVTESVRKELLQDPEVGFAKQALETIKAALRPFVLPEDAKAVAEEKDAEISRLQNELAEHKLQVKGLEEQNDQLASAAKEAGYRFCVERAIAGDPDSGMIRNLIGDVTKYNSSKDLKESISKVRTELKGKREEARQLKEHIETDERIARERKENERIRALKQEKSLREENAKLREALKKSTQANQALGVRAYAESRLVNHPKAASIRPLIESTHAQSQEEVDEILSQFREPARVPEQLESVRARVREMNKGGFGSTALEEEAPTNMSSRSNPLGMLGVDQGMMRSIRDLSGLGEKR